MCYMGYEYKVVKLHDYPDLIEQVAHLLSSEWPRSITARCHHLKKSSNNLPCSLVLLRFSNDDHVNKVFSVVGYSCLSRVLQQDMSGIIESVVIDKQLRGCGLGRILMEKSEDFARSFGFKTLHLSTTDKCMFYKHIGYHNSHPVSPEREVSRFFKNAQIKGLDGHTFHPKTELPPPFVSTSLPPLGDVQHPAPPPSIPQPPAPPKTPSLPLEKVLPAAPLSSPTPPQEGPPLPLVEALPIVPSPAPPLFPPPPPNHSHFSISKHTETIWMKKVI